MLTGVRERRISDAAHGRAPRRATLERQRQQRELHARRLIGRVALGCLHDELTLYPKPGLVSPVDNGSHHDMTAATFLRSLFALRHYFVAIAGAGQENAPFATLRRLGIAAEARMLKATGGVNTHRGAIFTLGLLAAALGHCQASAIALSPPAIRAALLIQ
ncbi:MAG: triphosphoribosyl-dephospho-CoA synthase, partial [Burkholderiaceae bacterium]